jgi:hypothetical protein
MIIMLLLATASVSTTIFAQDNIKAMLKKCESMEVIEASIIRNNKSLIKKPIRSTVTIKLHYTPELVAELVEAFYKDRELANSEIEQKKDGQMVSMLYKFDNSTYSFTVKDDTVNIQGVERNYSFRLR